jgi:hypothetical protein
MAYLHFEEDMGLSVLWFSALESEEIEFVRDLLRTPISSFVTRIDYAYYEMEDDEWELTDEPIEEDDGSFRLPHYLKLTFTHPEEGERTRSVLIPQTSNSVPLF